MPPARVAADYGAVVIPFDFSKVDFAAARNHAMKRATGRWILMLDADETLDGRVRRRSGGWRRGMKTRDIYAAAESWGRLRDSTTDHVVRLFPNRPDVRYRGRVHETIDAAILRGGGRLLLTEIRIDHNFAGDREARRRKNRWYIEILKEEIAADPNDDSRLDFLAAEYHQLEMFDEATAIAERIAAMRPLDARAHLFAGVYHMLFKPDLQRARADFGRAWNCVRGMRKRSRSYSR